MLWQLYRGQWRVVVIAYLVQPQWHWDRNSDRIISHNKIEGVYITYKIESE